MAEYDYQLIIVGGGPAGLTAGLYAARARLKALLLEKGAFGGQVLVTDWVDNYPGFVEGASGFDLMEKMAAHADRFGVEKRIGHVVSMDLAGEIKVLRLENGEELRCLAVILCTGARPRQLEVPGEKEFTGRGVSYCATCDAPFYREQRVVVAGGGNTAIQEALHLTKFASRVFVVHRRDSLRATKILQEKALASDRIEFVWNAQVSAIEGDRSGVNRVRIAYKDGTSGSLEVTGIFVLIGVIPNNETLPLSQLEADRWGFVKTDGEMQTSLAGVYAAGDIRSKNFRQIVNAAGEGANAELSAEEYLSQLAGHA